MQIKLTKPPITPRNSKKIAGWGVTPLIKDAILLFSRCTLMANAQTFGRFFLSKKRRRRYCVADEFAGGNRDDSVAIAAILIYRDDRFGKMFGQRGKHRTRLLLL